MGIYQWDVIYSGDTDNNSASDNNDPAEQVTATTAVTVPNGSFESTSPGLISGVGYNGAPCTLGTTTGSIEGWTITDVPITGGVYQTGGWGPTASVEIGIMNGPDWGNGPAPDGNQFLMLDPGEAYNDLTMPRGPFAQPGASMIATTTGISESAVAGTTYDASFMAANINKWGWDGPNPSFSPVGDDMTLNILANGVVVASHTVDGTNFTENDANNGWNTGNWISVNASWTADASHAGQAIQLQIVATNFLEDQHGNNTEWSVPPMGVDNVCLAAWPTPGAVATSVAVQAASARPTEPRALRQRYG